jgi:hypothetical protein
MYFWKIDQLNKDLVSNALPENEKFKYLVASTLFYSFAMIQYSSPNIYDTLLGAFGGLVALLGLFFIYKCNGGKNGKDIVIRYMTISWVIFIRMFVMLLLPTIILLIAVQEIYFGGLPDESSIIDLVYLTLMEIIYILWIAKHINRVAKESHA